MMRAIRRSLLAASMIGGAWAFALHATAAVGVAATGGPGAAGDATAAAGEGGITVHGVGTAKGHASVVEIGAKVSGEGVLAADANVKYTDTKKKAIAALEALKDPNLTIRAEGPSVGLATDPAAQMRVMQGMAGNDTGKQKVSISEQLRLVLKVPDDMPPDKLLAAVLKVIDTAKDAGLTVGAPPGNYFQMQIRAQMGGGGDDIVVFKIPDKSELEAQAYEKAVADAKAKAGQLAKIGGLKLGRIVSVQVSEGSAGASPQQSVIAAIYGEGVGAPTSSDSKEVEANAFGEIPVTARVIVRFEIER